MSTLDMALVIPMIWAGYKGFNKGFIIEVTSLIALCVGLWGAIHLSEYTTQELTGKIEEKYLPLASFTLTFIGIVAIVFTLGKILERFVNLIQLKLVNKLAGAGFGISKILLILGIALLIVNTYDEKWNIIPQQTKDDSLLYYPLVDFSQTLLPVLKENDITVPVLKADSLLLHHAIKKQQ